jgi:hypothetical protein
MRAYVLPDPRLQKLAGRFVRLDVDTEKPGNAPFVERFPIDAWPTLLAIDPATEHVVLRWAGTATAAQIERLALDAERAVRAGRASRADEALARADRLTGERRHAHAAAAYREALAAGGKGWDGRERAAEALVQALSFAGDSRACAAAAREVLPRLSAGPAARAAAIGIACAREAGGETAEKAANESARTAALDDLERAARRLLTVPTVLADDRSWLYDELSRAREDRGDAKGARKLALRWLAFLEGEASRAKTPLARSAFDGQRVNAAIRAGVPGRALPAVLSSERDLPDEFVPPSLAGVLYLELDRPKDALAAAERALSRAEGPRRIRVLVLKAQAESSLGDHAAARATLERALSEASALPANAQPRGWVKKAEGMLKEIGEGS